MVKFSEKAIFTLFIMAFAGLLFYLTINLSPVARFVPLIVLIPTLGLLIFQLVLDLVPGLEESYRRFEKADLFGIERIRVRISAEEVDKVSQSRQEVNLLLWLLMLLTFIYLFGLLIALPAYTFLYLRRRSRESWKLSIAIAVGIYCLIYCVFILALRMRLYEGHLFSWVGK
jgi:hypothetical protein